MTIETMNHSPVVLLTLFTLVCASGTAQSRPLELSQDQAVDRAVARHPALLASRNAALGARARVALAQSAWLPKVKLDASYLIMGPVQTLNMQVDLPLAGATPIRIERDMGSLNNASVGVTVAWRVFDFGVRDARIAAAKAAAAASMAEGRQRTAEIAYAVRVSYLAVLFYEEVIRATGRSMKVAGAELRDRQVQRKAGVGNDLDVARADIRIAQLTAHLSQARQEHARSLVNLRLLLGLKPQTPVILTDNLLSLGATQATASSSPRRHPSHVRLSALLRASRLEVQRLDRSFWPTLDLVGNVKFQYPKNYFENEEGGVAFTGGLLLSWSLFDGGILKQQREQALAKEGEVRALIQTEDESILRQIADARAKMRIATTAVKTSQRTLKSAEIYLRAAQASLKAGTGTALELRRAEETKDQAKLAEIKAYFDAAIARAAYLRAQGRKR